MKTKSRNPLKSYLINQQPKISTTFFSFVFQINWLLNLNSKRSKLCSTSIRKKRNKIKKWAVLLENWKNISIKHYVLSAKRETISKKMKPSLELFIIYYIHCETLFDFFRFIRQYIYRYVWPLLKIRFIFFSRWPMNSFEISLNKICFHLD